MDTHFFILLTNIDFTDSLIQILLKVLGVEGEDMDSLNLYELIRITRAWPVFGPELLKVKRADLKQTYKV